MARPLTETESALDRLAGEVRDLERRVHALEAGAAATGAPAAESAPASPSSYQSPFQPVVRLPDWFSTGLVPVLGTAILGIGGAYLLRALAESAILPRQAAVGIAVGYAALWLLRSRRQRSANEQAGIIYAATASMILMPMLWEATVRFKVLEPRVTAGMLIAFVMAGAAVAWTRDRSALVWATALPAAITAVALIVTTGELTPFTVALLAIAATVETAAVQDRWLSLRPVAAVFADTGIWLVLYVSALAETPGVYRPAARGTAVALAFGLLGIYASVMGCRAVLLRKKITPFEGIQTAAAWILAVGGTLRFFPEHAPLGAFCLLGAAACYFTAFSAVSPSSPEDGDHAAWNHFILAGYGLALLLAGSSLLVPGPLASLLWPGLAVAGMFAAARINSPALAMHAAICLMAGASVSGLFHYGWLAMTATSLPSLAGIVTSFVWVQAIAAVICYIECPAAEAGKWPRLVAASLAAYAMLAFGVTVLGAAYATGLAAIRTLGLCAEAVLAVALAARWPSIKSLRVELKWIGYAAIGLATAKLFAQDFHQDSPAALAISLLSYGTVLIVAPRLMRRAAPQ